MAKTANWIITFDDGPLPADQPTWTTNEDELLQPLKSILDTLAKFQSQPITAVFYMRGPQYPWADLHMPAPTPSDFKNGMRLIIEAGHYAGLHCFSHNPDRWRTLFPVKQTILQDLSDGLNFFGQFGLPMTHAMRAPYGGFTPAIDKWAEKWCGSNGYLYHEWALDTYDWLHHPDNPIPLFVDDAQGHLDFCRTHLKIYAPWEMGPKSRERDVLMHVSKRTAANLPEILECLVQVSEIWGFRPRFEIPSKYVSKAGG